MGTDFKFFKLKKASLSQYSLFDMSKELKIKSKFFCCLLCIDSGVVSVWYRSGAGVVPEW